MFSAQNIYLLVTFLSVFFVVLLVAFQLTGNTVAGRLGRLLQRPESTPARSSIQDIGEKIGPLFSSLGKWSLPAEGWENSNLRIRFMHAGYRGKSAPMFFFGAKTLLALGLPTFFLFYSGLASLELARTSIFMLVIILAAVGYYLPNFVLSRMIARRKRNIFETFPDALDLLVVCVEAGLALNAALVKVGEEIAIKSKILADELHLLNLELRAGASRERALRNFALRTGVEDVNALVSMLVQADRFGVNIADALRVQSEALRTKRRLIAEEKAAKLPVKLLLPLLFCIFPALLLVMLGPAIIRIKNILLPILAGQ